MPRESQPRISGLSLSCHGNLRIQERSDLRTALLVVSQLELASAGKRVSCRVTVATTYGTEPELLHYFQMDQTLISSSDRKSYKGLCIRGGSSLPCAQTEACTHTYPWTRGKAIILVGQRYPRSEAVPIAAFSPSMRRAFSGACASSKPVQQVSSRSTGI